MLNLFFRFYMENLNGKKINKFICSINGINVRPNTENNKHPKDWNHCDQTMLIDINMFKDKLY